MLETIEDECEVAFEVSASGGFLDARERKVGVWNVVGIDDEIVVVVKSAMNCSHVELHLQPAVHDGEVDCIDGTS